MRISVLEQVKAFLKHAKQNNEYVYESKKIKLTIKNYLVQKNMLYSPIRGIFILKKSEQFDSEVLEKFKFNVLEKLGWILSWDFATRHFLWDIWSVKIFEIITKNKNFESKLSEKYQIKFKASKVPRYTKDTKIGEATLKIEQPFSLYINNYKNIAQNSDFIRYLMSQDIFQEDIQKMIQDGFKASWIAKLALLFKQNGFAQRHKMIMTTLRQAGKQIDYRKATTQKNTTKKTLNSQTHEDLDSLI